jgi:hypothetical protein
MIRKDISKPNLNLFVKWNQPRAPKKICMPWNAILSIYFKISYCYLSELHLLWSFKISKFQGVTWAKRSSPKALLWFLDAFMCVLPQSCSGTNCDRTTSEMRGLCPKIISGDSRRSENVQTHTRKHIVPNMKFKLKLLKIKCHVLGFTKDQA